MTKTEYKVYGLKEKLGWYFVYSIEKKQNEHCKNHYHQEVFNWIVEGYIYDSASESVVCPIQWCKWSEKTEVTEEDEAYILGRILRYWIPEDKGFKLDNEEQWKALEYHLEHVRKCKEYPEEPLKNLV